MTTQTVYTNKDSWVELEDSGNHGTENVIQIALDEVGGTESHCMAYLGFDITSCPNESSVSSVYLYVRVYDYSPCDHGTWEFQQIIEPWTETGIDWFNKPNTTSENQYTHGAAINENTWYSYDITNIYKKAKNDGNELGIRIRQTDNYDLYHQLCSREYADGAYSPYIVITYDELETIIYGDIQDRFGSGVSNCHVTAEDDVTHIEYYDTDADGEYSVVVGNESHYYTVSVWHSGYVVRSRTIGVTANTFNQCDFIPPSYNLVASVEGTVEDNYGNPVENAFVWGEGTNWYGCKTNANGEYALPLHTGGTYDIKACKTNFNERSYGSITQSGYHPTTDEQTTKNFTGTYCLERILGTDDLGFAVYGRSVVIPDDLPTTSSIITADEPATTTVKLKTWKFGSGAALTTTSSGTSDSSEGEGSGGTNYKGDCGDCGE